MNTPEIGLNKTKYTKRVSIVFILLVVKQPCSHKGNEQLNINYKYMERFL